MSDKMEVDSKIGFVTECGIGNLHISNMIEKFKSKEYEKWQIWFSQNESKLKNYLSDPKLQIAIVAITGSKLDIIKKIQKKNVNILHLWTTNASEMWAIKAEAKATMKPVLISNRVELDIQTTKHTNPPTFRLYSQSKSVQFELKNDGEYVLGFIFDYEGRFQSKIIWNQSQDTVNSGSSPSSPVSPVNSNTFSNNTHVITFPDATQLQKAICYRFKELKIMVMSQETNDAIKFLSSPYQNDLRRYDDNFRFCLRLSSSNPESSLVIVHYSLTDDKYRQNKKWELGAKINEEKIEIHVVDGKAFYEKKVGQNTLKFYNPDEFLSYLNAQFHDDLTNPKM